MIKLTKILNESTPSQVIKDLDKAKNDLFKKVNVLIAKKKKLYSDVDIESPMSADEKKLDKDIADLFSQINKLVLQKRSVKKESVNERYRPNLESKGWEAAQKVIRQLQSSVFRKLDDDELLEFRKAIADAFNLNGILK